MFAEPLEELQQLAVELMATVDGQPRSATRGQLDQWWPETRDRVERLHELAHEVRVLFLIDLEQAYFFASPDKSSHQRAIDLPTTEAPRSSALPRFAPIRDWLQGREDVDRRAAVALNAAELVIEHIPQGKQELLAVPYGRKGPTGEAALLALCTTSGRVPISNPEEENPAVAEGFASAVTIAGAAWVMIREHGLAQSNRGSKPTLPITIQELKPALTWREVLYHYIRYLEGDRGNPTTDRNRVALGKYLAPPKNRLCIECDQAFPIDRRNPGRFICPKCNAARRQRRRRARLEASSSRT